MAFCSDLCASAVTDVSESAHTSSWAKWVMLSTFPRHCLGTFAEAAAILHRPKAGPVARPWDIKVKHWTWGICDFRVAGQWLGEMTQ